MVYLFITGSDHPSLQETFGKRGTCNSPQPQLNMLFHLPMEKTHWFLFWGFSLDMSGNTWFSVLFSSMTSTALLHHPFSVIRMGNCQRSRGKGEVVSLLVPWRKLLWNFAFFTMVSKDCLVLFLHMANDCEGKRKSCLLQTLLPCLSWSSHVGWLRGLSCPMPRVVPDVRAAPVAPSPGWSHRMGTALLPCTVHSCPQLQGRPPGSHCWHAGSHK